MNDKEKELRDPAIEQAASQVITNIEYLQTNVADYLNIKDNDPIRAEICLWLIDYRKDLMVLHTKYLRKATELFSKIDINETSKI